MDRWKGGMCECGGEGSEREGAGFRRRGAGGGCWLKGVLISGRGK